MWPSLLHKRPAKGRSHTHFPSSPAPASSMRTAQGNRTHKTQLFRILPHRASVRHFQKRRTLPSPRRGDIATVQEHVKGDKYSEIQPTHDFTCPHCGTFSISMTILSVNLLKNRFTVKWAHFHAHDSPTGQSRQRFRGHTRHGDTTSPDHPRGHRARHRSRRHRSAPAEQHTGHRHGHGARHPRLHGQVHARTG